MIEYNKRLKEKKLRTIISKEKKENELYKERVDMARDLQKKRKRNSKKRMLDTTADSNDNNDNDNNKKNNNKQQQQHHAQPLAKKQKVFADKFV